MFMLVWILVGAVVLALIGFAGYWFGRAMRAITPQWRPDRFGFKHPGFWHTGDGWDLMWGGSFALVALVFVCWILGAATFVLIERPWEKRPAEAAEVAR